MLPVRLPTPALPAALVLLGLVTACGSTAQISSTVSMGGVGPDGVAPGASVPGDMTGTPGGALAPAAPAGGTAPTRTGAGAPATVTGPQAAASAPGSRPSNVTIPAKGPGWDSKYVYLGVTTQKDVNAAAESVGANGLDAGDQEGQAKAVVDELNRRGGLFGRQLKLVFKDQSTVATAQDPNTAGNAACTYFTQDHRVIGLLSPVTLMDVPSFRACMAKHKVPLFSASVAAVDQKVGQSLAPYFYQSVAPTWDVLAPVLTRSLKAQGWFGGWNPLSGAPAQTRAKVGVLVPSDDISHRVGILISKALAAVGSPDAVVYEYGDGSDMSSAVVNFNGNGVTHVISANSDLISFQLSANSQGYRPRYGISSYNAPVTFLEINSPGGQNVGALGVGWSASLDVSDANDPLPMFDRAGIPYELWDADELARRVPGIDVGKYWPPNRVDDPAFWADATGSLGALWTPDGGFVDDPALAAVNLANSARRRGARLLFGRSVVAVLGKDAVQGVRLSDGTTVSAPVVINVAGPWSGALNDLAGVGAGWSVSVRPMRQEVHHVPAPAGFNRADGLGPVVADLDLGTYLRGTPGNGFLVGGTEPECDPLQWVDDPDNINPNPTPAVFEAQVTRAARRFPELGVPGKPLGLAGVYDVTEDWTPIYDRTEREGFLVAIGTSGNQFKNAPVAGKLMSALVKGRDDRGGWAHRPRDQPRQL